MLKRPITYEDFEGNQVTEEFYFNLSKTDLITMEADVEGGMEAALLRIVKSEDRKQLVAEFKAIILKSYGIRSEDGKRFIKSDEIREDFTHHAAFDALFIELASDDTKAYEFLMGVMPKDLAEQVAAQTPQDKPTGPPPRPVTAPPLPPTQ